MRKLTALLAALTAAVTLGGTTIAATHGHNAPKPAPFSFSDGR